MCLQSFTKASTPLVSTKKAHASIKETCAFGVPISYMKHTFLYPINSIGIIIYKFSFFVNPFLKKIQI